MSYWGATVITNLVSVIPEVGTIIVYWLWGAFSIVQATLNRFFSFHFVLPFIIFALSCIHLVLLHDTGSSNTTGNQEGTDEFKLYPFYIFKDLYGLNWLLIIFFIFICFSPNYLGHPDNYILANSLVTPPHIVPEWYFLPFYAILRSIVNKLLGVTFMACSIFVFLLLPFMLWFSTTRSNTFKPLQQPLFYIFIINVLVLGIIGGKPVIYPFFELGKFLTFCYFFIFFIFVFFSLIEYIIYKLKSTSTFS